MDSGEALAALSDGDVDRRRDAARTLFHATRVPRREHGLDRDALPTLAAATTDEDALVRGHATAVLGDLGVQCTTYDEPVPELAAVLDRLRDDDAAVRQTALGVLSGRPDRFPRLFGDGGARTDAETVDAAGADAESTDAEPADAESAEAADVRALAARGLIDCLQSSSDVVRSRAARTLTPSLAVAHPAVERTAVPALVTALEDGHRSVRTNAASLLAEVAARRPGAFEGRVDDLHGALRSDDESVRLGAAETLARIGATDDESIRQSVADALTALVDDASERTAEAAVSSLRELVESAPELAAPASDALVEALSSPEYDIRSAAAAALADFAAAGLADPATDGPEAVPPIAAAFRDADTDEPLDEAGVYPLAVLAESHPAAAGEHLAALCRRSATTGAGFGLGQASVCVRVADVAPDAVAPAVSALADLLSDEIERSGPVGDERSGTDGDERSPTDGDDAPAATDRDERRDDAALTLGGLATEYPDLVVDAVPELTAVVGTLDSHPRRVTAAGLVHVAWHDPAVVRPHAEALVPLLRDPEARVRNDVGVALALAAAESDADDPRVATTLAEHLRTTYDEHLDAVDHLVSASTRGATDRDRPYLTEAAPEWPLGPVVAEHPEFVPRDAAAERAAALRDDAEPEAVAAFLAELAAGSIEHVPTAVEELTTLLEAAGDAFARAAAVLASVARIAPEALPDEPPAGLEPERLRRRCEGAADAREAERETTGHLLGIAAATRSEAVDPALDALADHLDEDGRWRAIHVLAVAAETTPDVVAPVADDLARAYRPHDRPPWTLRAEASFDALDDALEAADVDGDADASDDAGRPRADAAAQRESGGTSGPGSDEASGRASDRASGRGSEEPDRQEDADSGWSPLDWLPF